MNHRYSKYFMAFWLLMIGLLSIAPAFAQRISTADKNELKKKEDTLKKLSASMVFSEQAADRFRSDSSFTRAFVRALKVKNAFYYPFDSLNISKLYAPDSTFRIFTWQLKKDEYVYLQKGAIQMNMPDGSLKLFPLFDVSMFTSKPLDSVRTRNNWIGAIYYRIIAKEFNGKKYYTLLGFDDYSVSSNRKWMEVLHFNERGEPVFGGSMISFKDDTAKKAVQSRFNIEYKKEAKTFFNYDPEKDMIVFDHLISESNEPERKSTYIPDGDFEAFKWQNGQWVHVERLEFELKLKDGQFPTESTILDDAGNINERQLEEASRRNMEREAGSPEKTPATPKKSTQPKKKG
ncbi:hypothetical protein FAM09_17195 [Niastella caeni]|uniref:Outer membrane lipoprotein-sorting protein n=1 Tax=Niastella caeni TaxID=2569763 RepID=A0A4V4H0Y5_9BACT|nr:hypothetical protein [Niastella caeni]THU38406.1 hypothetical protein FAM09_17195 [Niastella caeni]